MRKSKDKKTIIFEAVSFGYGPASIAIAIAEELYEEVRSRSIPIKLIALGKDVSYELFSSSNLFDKVLEFRDYDLKNWSLNIKDELQRADIIISIDPDFANAVYKILRRKVIFIDPLYWMWVKDPIDINLCEKYYALNFPGVSDKVAKTRSKILNPDILKVVDAVRDNRTLSRVSSIETKDLLLINFGGMQYPFGSNVNLALSMTKIILDVALSLDHYNEVIICGGGKPIKQLAESLNRVNEKVKVRTSPQEPFEFLKLLASCRTLLTVPGMSIVYEALYLSKPTLFILPLNYSQHLQVKIYKEILKNATFITWDDLEGYQMLPPGLPEEEGVKLAIELGEKFHSDLNAQAEFKDLVTKFFSSKSLLKGISLKEGFELGFNGAQQIAKDIFSKLGCDVDDF
jgi:hypothetical protein